MGKELDACRWHTRRCYQVSGETTVDDEKEGRGVGLGECRLRWYSVTDKKRSRRGRSRLCVDKLPEISICVLIGLVLVDRPAFKDLHAAEFVHLAQSIVLYMGLESGKELDQYGVHSSKDLVDLIACVRVIVLSTVSLS